MINGKLMNTIPVHSPEITTIDLSYLLKVNNRNIRRPVIKENTVRVVAARENNVLLLWRVISLKLNIGKKITGLEIMTPNREKI